MQVYVNRLHMARGNDLRVARKLELGGDLAVQPGDSVDVDSLLGHNSAEELLHYLRVEVDESRLLAKLLKQVGDEVKRGEPVAYYMFMFGLGYREYISPVNGTIVSFDPRTGLIGIREHRAPLYAGLPGVVVDVVPDYGVILSVAAALVGATAGWGGAAWGELYVLAAGRAEVVEPNQIGPPVRGKVVLVGACADERILHACYRYGARAVIAGGVQPIAAEAFTDFAAAMTYEEYATRYYSGAETAGVMPDGADSVPMPIIALEGLGTIPLRQAAYSMLLAAAGRHVFIDASGESGVLGDDPAVVVPSRPGSGLPDGGPVPATPVWEHNEAPIAAGALVRIIGGQYNGIVGTVRHLMGDVLLPTGCHTAGAMVDLMGRDGTSEVGVPYANLELVDTI